MFTTNNEIMLKNFNNQKVVNCVQKTAEKKVLDDPIKTEQILLESNKLGFGDEIGKITNRITSMFDLICNFDSDTREYKTLMYRIMASQMYAQMAIDKVKGIITNGMPKHWYRKISEPVTEEDEFNNSICVDRKPYFMSYIYPDLRKDYNKFLKAQNQGLRRTSDFESAKEFFNNNNPVNDNGCVMNRLCHMVENAFSDYRKIIAKKDFDPEILKTELKYNKNKYNKVFELYRSYCERKSWLVISGETIRTNSDTEDDLNEINLLKESFIKQCHEICSNEEELCNIVVDICYSSKGRKTFAWEMCGDQIIKNLLAKNDNKISYITKDKDGDIEYHGDKFSKKTIDLNTSAL